MEQIIIGMLLGFVIGCLAVFTLWTYTDKKEK
jgi:hypothetical protein